jgi:GNAT superfamily N-acetyltransferase
VRPSAEIRRLTRADLPACNATMPSWNGAEYERRLREQDRGLAVQLVAWVGEEAVGRAMLVLAGNEEWSASAFRETCAEIRDLAVESAWQRRGIGRSLIASLEAEARAAGARRIGLGVGLDDDYAAARAMYEGLGYRFAHGPFVGSAKLDRADGSSFAVAGAQEYRVKDL